MKTKDIVYLKGKEAVLNEFFMILILIILTAPLIIIFTIRFLYSVISFIFEKQFSYPIDTKVAA